MDFYDMQLKKNDRILVGKVLEQGQKLRNAMAESILKNDPFYTEVIYKTHFNTPNASYCELTKGNTEENKICNKNLLEAFIKGDSMTREDEKVALDSLKSLSAPELLETTEKSLTCSKFDCCKCYTCEVYNSEYWKWDPSQNVNTTSEGIAHRNNNRDKNKSEIIKVLKFVDSLKVSVNCIILNDTGQQKLFFTLCDQSNSNFCSQSFFLEYTIPDLISTSHKLHSTMNMDNNYVRLFSRKYNDAINFKKVTVHNIARLEDIDLSCCNMQFKVSFRNFRQKSTILLGYANFNFGEFLLTKNATCSRGLVVNLNDYTPISVGTLKVSLQLGCGRLYFGQGFIDAVITSNRESVVLDSDDSTNNLVDEQEEKLIQNPLQTKNSRQSRRPVPKSVVGAQPSTSPINHPKVIDKPHERDGHLKKVPFDIVKSVRAVSKLKNNKSSHFNQLVHNPEPASRIAAVEVVETEKQVLFGFFYIAEAQYISRPINSYLTCCPFTQNETSVSQLIGKSQNPVFNFHQIIPLVFDDDLLLRLRENYMVIEFWQKEDTVDEVIGLTKIPLHQFYLAYRNPVILKYLIKNKLPIIGTDWWEPIYSVNNEEILGQVQVLTALGTQEQVQNLKIDRGFAGSFVKAQFTNPKSGLKQTEIIHKDYTVIKKHTAFPSKKIILTELPYSDSKLDTLGASRIGKSATSSEKLMNASKSPVSTLDTAIQCEMNMENPKEKEEKNTSNVDMLQSFLQQLMTTRQRNMRVENSTNTEPVQGTEDGNSNLHKAQNKTNMELRKTSDLLDSLQKVLSVENQFPSTSKIESTFKAMVAINIANHLPSRKKCKSRKSKSGPIKNEESVLPSCYVSFEASCEEDLKITHIISKSTNPMWNYKCEVNLPLELVKKGHKRLIFKVWRKSTNTNNLPNMQTDIVIGFAAVDLTVLLAGFPNVQGWFNILDFSGKCNGQINIHITPLEDLSKYQTTKINGSVCNKKPTAVVSTSNEASETLSRVLKRKFTELDEITQRLRLRLSKVTNDSDSSSDGFADEFEKDISSFREEDNLDDFTEEVRKLNVERIVDNVTCEKKSNVNLDPILLSTKGSYVQSQEPQPVSIGNFESEPGIFNTAGEADSAASDAGEN